jgi:hypothetical protein
MANHLEIISPSQTADLVAAKTRRGEHARLLGLPHPTSSPEGRPLDATLWPRVRRHIEGQVNSFEFEVDFATTRLIDDDGSVLTVAVGPTSSGYLLKRRYADLVVEALTACGRGDASVRLVSHGQG